MYALLYCRVTAIGCPDLTLPSSAWSKRMGDNVMIRCNETMETFYLTCQANRWIGEVGNCSHSKLNWFQGMIFIWRQSRR